jgi:hypothetical protein
MIHAIDANIALDPHDTVSIATKIHCYESA